ncbi:helix-turn-helix transcriptional regulator [Xanthobacter aminoxidans]|uniref:helix-turn-helix transcriptional regulator n=1 Tax=Xanthobacter aminoxidans TaxID=186280 RepID=UPI002022D107|nr:helix-turn-helix domain-containing protein [Xanthobacter aminoxidans]MCL8382487.1 helix-turn-helix domain-containing protein [Xanthobacter aminoxidans]
MVEANAAAAPDILPAFFANARLTAPEASAYLGYHLGCSVAVATLARWRCVTSFGPPFHRIGRRVVYARSDLDAWINKRLGNARRSTSQTVAAA